MEKSQSFGKRLVGKVEPALQHNGFAITFIFTYIIVNIVFFLKGCTTGYTIGRHEGYVIFDILARGGGSLLNVNSALVIFVASKSLMTYLRRTALNMIVPFDKAMPAMHTIIGNVLAIATVIHVVFQTCNYAVMNMWFNYGDRTGIFGMRSLAVTGALLLFIIAAMRITSLAIVRKKNYESFYWVHNAGFVCYFILLIIHGVRQGTATTYRYVGVPILIYMIDRALRFSREKGSKLMVTADSLVQKGPGMVILRLPRPFSYLAGQYCDIRVPVVSRYEWHPFTIASSPHESEMLFFIKDNGDWTHKLYELAGNPDELQNNICVHVRGPYGAPAQHVGQYEHVVLISGGIGATPFASITKYAHHWILNYTPRGNAAATSVSAAFTRNQSTHLNSVPSTPSGYRRSIDNSRRSAEITRRSVELARNLSRNISSRNSRNFSRSASRNLSRNMSRNKSRPGSRPLSRSTSASRFERSQSVDSVGVIIQEQRMNQPFGPLPMGGQASALSIEIPSADRKSNRSNDLSRYFASSPQPPNPPTNRDSLPEDYVIELGDPDAPIPSRRSLTPAASTDGLLASGRHMMEVVREYDSSKELLDDDDDDDIAMRKPDSLNGLDENIEFGEFDPEIGGIQLEDEILREQQTASNAYNMLGMSFGSAGLLRHFQKHDNMPMRSSMMRASLNVIDNALDSASWQDRLMFYLHTVTLNWMLLWIMILRFALVAAADIIGRITAFNRPYDIYNSIPFAIVDLILACILIVPVLSAIATEIAMCGLWAYLGDQIGNVFDLFVLLPLLISSIVFISMVSFTPIEISRIKPITIYLIWPLTTLLLLWRTGRTIGSRISLAQYFKSTHAQTKSLDFIWVAKTQEEDHWLIDQLLPLAGSGIVRLHRFITRSNETTEPWMLDFEKVPLKTTYRRPDWDEVFGNLVERSRSGTVVGVFFCGPDNMARAIQQAAMKAMAVSVENALQRGYVNQQRIGNDALRSNDEDTHGGMSRNRSNRSAGGGVFSRVASKAGELARTISSRRAGRNAASPMPDDVKDHSAFGCNVRISVRIENFN